MDKKAELSQATHADAEATVAASTSTNPAIATKIFVFKIRVKHGHTVPIWRMVEMPATYSFYDLHVAIQDSMEWSDSHLHEFKMKNPANNRTVHIGIVNDCEWREKPFKPEKHTPIANYFSLSNPVCTYEYDFGSPWSFKIKLKRILDKDPNVSYPRSVAGSCAPPPEEYPEDPLDVSWADQPFDHSSITFRDPVEAWKDAFENFNRRVSDDDLNSLLSSV